MINWVVTLIIHFNGRNFRGEKISCFRSWSMWFMNLAKSPQKIFFERIRGLFAVSVYQLIFNKFYYVVIVVSSI